MRVTSDFECGNGKSIDQVVPGHWRIEEVGEKPPYCKYFCVRLDPEGDGGSVQLDVYPDPDLGEAGREGMMGHYPSQIWYSTDEMETWRPTEHVWEGSTEFHESHLTVRVQVKPDQPLYLASNAVAPYSRVADWAVQRGQMPSHCDSLSLGRSHEGRPIPLLYLPASGADAASVFVLAGQHPSEHLGVYAAMGTVEFLQSAHPEASALRERFEFWVCPMINVDGNIHGRNGWTMQGVNMSGDFVGAAEGAVPQAAEDRALWRHLGQVSLPVLSLQFHGFMGKRAFIDPPYDGLYVLEDPESVYEGSPAAERYRALQDVMKWDSDGLMGGGRPGTIGEGFVEYQLARLLGTIPVFYEINHGYCGVWGAKRRGAQVLRTALKALG